jgi:hypothetical protein
MDVQAITDQEVGGYILTFLFTAATIFVLYLGWRRRK